MKTLAVDPGKHNSWFAAWDEQRLYASGKLDTPTDLIELVSKRFQLDISRFLKGHRIGYGDEVVIERYQHRGAGVGGNQSEITNLLIAAVAIAAQRSNAVVYLVTPSAHKNSYQRFHRHYYPVGIIERLGNRHGTWRKRLERNDPCLHVMDAATLGCYRILKRKGRI